MEGDLEETVIHATICSGFAVPPNCVCTRTISLSAAAAATTTRATTCATSLTAQWRKAGRKKKARSSPAAAAATPATAATAAAAAASCTGACCYNGAIYEMIPIETDVNLTIGEILLVFSPKVLLILLTRETVGEVLHKAQMLQT